MALKAASAVSPALSCTKVLSRKNTTPSFEDIEHKETNCSCIRLGFTQGRIRSGHTSWRMSHALQGRESDQSLTAQQSRPHSPKHFNHQHPHQHINRCFSQTHPRRVLPPITSRRAVSPPFVPPAYATVPFLTHSSNTLSRTFRPILGNSLIHVGLPSTIKSIEHKLIEFCQTSWLPLHQLSLSTCGIVLVGTIIPLAP
jgi:hypothetical protein